jgi:nucleotide-binding universal stress UspA family protein
MASIPPACRIRFVGCSRISISLVDGWWFVEGGEARSVPGRNARNWTDSGAEDRATRGFVRGSREEILTADRAAGAAAATASRRHWYKSCRMVARRIAMKLTIKRILVPTDFSQTSDAALDFARAIAETLGASLHLLHVFEDPFVSGAFAAETYAPMAPATRAALIDDATARLGHRLPDADRARFRGTTEIVTGLAASSIVDYARERQIDLIVMGTHGRTGVAHLLLGSVAERVVRTADCPVLTVHKDRGVVPQPHRERSYFPEMPLEIPA